MNEYGPENPHPLSRMKTELVWEGKYDEFGRRRAVSLPTFPLAMQRIETIDEPRDRSKAQGTLFEPETAHRDDFRNRLIWGDNKLALAALLPDFRSKVKLIYIDPPFDVKADFSLSMSIGDSYGDEIDKRPSVLEDVAYRDIWGKGVDSFLHVLYERILLMRDLLSDDGSIMVHMGSNVSSLVRGMLNEIFGVDNFRNEIILPGRAVKNLQQLFSAIQKLQVRHDVLFWYSKNPQTRFEPFWVEKHNTGNPEGHWHHFWSNANRPTMRYEIFGVTPASGQWVWRESRALKAIENYERFEKEGGGRLLADYWRDTGSCLEFIRPAPDDGRPQYWREPAELRMADTIWTGIPIYSNAWEYPTEKHPAFLTQVINLASGENDIIADFFCGSGTALTVAETLGRKWIGCDLGRYAIHTTRKRLIEIQRDLHETDSPYRSFDVYNLGRYERQWWQLDRLKGADEEHRATVLKFFKAHRIESSPNPLLHGTKGGAYVHVDAIDSLLSFMELTNVANAVSAAGGKALICLAWEFEMDLRKRAQSLEAEYGLTIQLKYIPREIMEPNRDEIQFFDAGALEAKAVAVIQGGETIVDVELTNFYPSLSEVPEKELEELRERAIKSPFDFIDFWAIDFEHSDDKPFEHHWQDFRTRKDRTLETKSSCGWKYATSGMKRICVKVIDVFGIDTTQVIEVAV